ncbi:hypothetical protein QEJ31_03090 [Pigmentibacter sp. JX0631]|uniref:Ppx/GppA phosphatase family protein n=1 Tax=Pigmentibacter sp. JX0631 TaxID=2976982 RepID=UPI002468BB46|nr:hypothetical protein [Pigmentibacter sp. JX0631]WGL60586.1 hypothetical protein QEJ31_03090 [Pigmentibacter sp. JX0631]
MFLRNIVLGSITTIVLVSFNANATTKDVEKKAGMEVGCVNEIRGGYDIGSGSTKLQIALVKVCENGKISIEKSFFKENANVQYSAALIDDPLDSMKKILPDSIINTGYDAMLNLKRKGLEALAEQCGSSCIVSNWRGIMTAAFRKAENWKVAQEKLSEVVPSLLIKRLSQEEEALYGFYPVLKIQGVDPKNTVVWDMGGGSTQITAFSKDFTISNDFSASGVHVLETSIGSGTFEDVLRKFEDILITFEPTKNNNLRTFNPVDSKINIAKLYVKNELDKAKKNKEEISNKFFNLFVDNKKYYVIGGILSRSIPSIIKGSNSDYNVFNYDQVTHSSVINPICQDTINYSFNIVRNFSDNDLKKYAVEHDIISKKEVENEDNDSRYKSISSNLLLTKLYMESVLDINCISPIKIDGTDTLMISPVFQNENYWKIDNASLRQ